MYKRFIHEVTAQNAATAATSYQNTKFSRLKGAPACFNDLQCHASCMVQLLDEYSMKRKFLKGLPEDLVENLLKSRRVSVEHTSITKLLREVKAMESSIQAYHNYKNKCTEHSSNPQSTSKSSTHPSGSMTRPPQTVRFIRRSSGNHQGGPQPNRQSQCYQTQGSHCPSGNDRTPTANNSGGDREMRQNTPRPSGNFNRSGSSGNIQSCSSEVTCFKCSKKGHCSSNCPKNRP
jgi:hypothetical protein